MSKSLLNSKPKPTPMMQAASIVGEMQPLTVADLIAQLQQADPTAVIRFEDTAQPVYYTAYGMACGRRSAFFIGVGAP